MTSVGANFWCGRPHGAVYPLSPSTCVHLSLTPFPSCERHKWMVPYKVGAFRVESLLEPGA